MDRQRRQQKAELLEPPSSTSTSRSSTPARSWTPTPEMAFSARNIPRAGEIYDRMPQDQSCAVILTSPAASAPGLKQVSSTWSATHGRRDRLDRRQHRRPDFFEAWASATTRLQSSTTRAARAPHRPHLRHVHRRGRAAALRQTIKRDRRLARAAAVQLARVHPRDGRWLLAHRAASPSRNDRADRLRAGRADILPGVLRLLRRLRPGRPPVGTRTRQPTIDSVRTSSNSPAQDGGGDTGLLMIGGGVPKNFAQDTVVAAEILGQDADAQVRRANHGRRHARRRLSGSTLKEACSWGKVDTGFRADGLREATLALPLLAAYAYHNRGWRKRPQAAAGEAPGALPMVHSIINCATPEAGRRGDRLGARGARRLVRPRREPGAGGDRRLSGAPDRAARAPHPDRARLATTRSRTIGSNDVARPAARRHGRAGRR